MIQLETDRGETLKVEREDAVFSMARDVVAGRNVLAVGNSGTGKSVRGQSLVRSGNYAQLLANTPLKNLAVEVVHLEVDLIPILANLELIYEQNIENGNTFKTPANIAEFILHYGLKTKPEFLEQEAACQKVLASGEGKLNRYTLVVDDFDRTQNKTITNSFMKFIENRRHRLWNGEVRFLNLQCIASSNSTCGRSSARYIGSQGIDLAIYNRFRVYHIEEPGDTARILQAEFPSQSDFINRLVDLSTRIRAQMAEGAFDSLGVISLRQLRPIVEDHAHFGVPPLDAAAVLFSPLAPTSEERVKAEMILNQCFGKTPNNRRFAF